MARSLTGQCSTRSLTQQECPVQLSRCSLWRTWRVGWTSSTASIVENESKKVRWVHPMLHKKCALYASLGGSASSIGCHSRRCRVTSCRLSGRVPRLNLDAYSESTMDLRLAWHYVLDNELRATQIRRLEGPTRCRSSAPPGPFVHTSCQTQAVYRRKSIASSGTNTGPGDCLQFSPFTTCGVCEHCGGRPHPQAST